MLDETVMEEGWYLMSTEQLERELARRRDPDGNQEPSGALKLPVEEALAYRDAGNLPDDAGRTLRLVLRIEHREALEALDARRLLYEPDYHDTPEWRREGSAPVNIVPLRDPHVVSDGFRHWLEDPELESLEEEWQACGTVGGVRVPGALRGFVYKTVLALRVAGKDVTAETVADSVARWLPASEAEAVRSALIEANRSSSGP